MDMENVDLKSTFDTEERLMEELEEFSLIEKFKLLFDTEKILLDELDELNIQKKEILKELKEILFDRDEKEKELKQINELIEKQKKLHPKEYEEIKNNKI